MKRKTSKIKLRNANDLDLAIEKYRHEVQLQEQLIFSGVKDLRKSFIKSVEDALRSYTQQWVMIRVMEWVQTAISKRRKRRKKQRSA